ncbi:MAG: transketolase [Patescibacteria group bacterium]|nr:transketolase [Patescibacteria group bacterium]
MDKQKLSSLSAAIRKDILQMTTRAGSGHPTSSLSATDICVVLFEHILRFDPANPNNPRNDRLIFSKGHASPLFYSLYRRAGILSPEEVLTYRMFESPLEGHPTRRFPFTEAATGSLGQGLAIGVGEAYALRQSNHADEPRVYVLLGDGEMAEGSVWEAVAAASLYKLKNLIAIIDVNAFGQSQGTMYGHDADVFQRRFSSFDWDTVVIDGHNFDEIYAAFQKSHDRPLAIIAKTIKGKGVSFLEGKDGWHGKVLPETDLTKALEEIGTVDETIMFSRQQTAVSSQQTAVSKQRTADSSQQIAYDHPVATRRAFGDALAVLVEAYPDILVLDGDTKNSTYTEIVAKKYPKNFLELFIVEQLMASVAVGVWRMGRRPVVSTFAAFLTRAFDQIRMASVSSASILFNGSHAGVSIGQDGASQMGLEDLAMFRAVIGSTVVYPSDPYQTYALMNQLIAMDGIRYIRTTRGETPVIYSPSDAFPIGGSKTFDSKLSPSWTVVAAGITLHEALAAQTMLEEEGIGIRVIDCYSVKPIDEETIKRSAKETRGIIVVEDHYPEGGIGESLPVKPIVHLAVRKPPRSGKPEELLRYEDIDRYAIVQAIKSVS